MPLNGLTLDGLTRAGALWIPRPLKASRPAGTGRRLGNELDELLEQR